MLDLSLSPVRHPLCSGVSRRDFLRIGALAPLGLSLSQLLSAERAMASGTKTRAKSVILVYLGGGISHHDSFDPKPDAVEEIRGKYKSIPTNVPGLHVTELLPNMAKVMDKVALVRGGSHENDHHETATNWVLSGRFGSAFGDHPAIGADEQAAVRDGQSVRLAHHRRRPKQLSSGCIKSRHLVVASGK